jgi:hypothetical protein
MNERIDNSIPAKGKANTTAKEEQATCSPIHPFMKEPYHVETNDTGINNNDRTKKKTLLISFSFLLPVHTQTIAAKTRMANSKKTKSTPI